jgi:hypothetical protein
MSLEDIESALSPYLGKAGESKPQVSPKTEPIPFDLALLYRPECQIKALPEVSALRLRVRAQWHMDDNRVIDTDTLTALSKDCAIGKGLSKMILTQALENVRA